jgi:uncharacterized repeat protein (TIGR03803 family)
MADANKSLAETRYVPVKLTLPLLKRLFSMARKRTVGMGGGAHFSGTVYSISTSGSESVLYTFAGGSDGASPMASLLDVNGTLYGTTEYDGNKPKCNCGTVFALTP